MAIKKCDICGKEFDAGRGNKRACDECHHVCCEVCGKKLYLTGPKFTKYRQRGWVVCSKKCGAEMTRRGLMEREGIENVAQRSNVREVLRNVRFNDSEETKAKRSASLKVSANDPDVRKRTAKTNTAKYGVSCPLSIPEVHEKGIAAAACIERHNETGDRIEEYVSEHPDASITEVARKLGLSYQVVQKQNKTHGYGIKLYRSSSYHEAVVAQYLDSLGVEYKRNDRTQIKPYELDFYIEHNGRKVAIEVNDFATHNMNVNPYGGSPKPHRYHYDKTLACRERGIALIHAWEHCLPDFDGRCRFGSWGVLKNRIEHALGLTPVRHYARDMRVVEFPASETRAFFDANNVNGYRRAKTTYALVPKSVESPTPDDIVMAYAVGDAFFGKGRYDAEIARGACRLHETVVGGASKLWKHITGTDRYSSIVYYVDLNYYGADSMPDMDGVRFVEHRDSFWNFWTETGELKNREPRRNREITAGYRDGSVWKVENAGTDVYVWEGDNDGQ